MKEEKTLYDRYKDDILSDNSNSQDCMECRDCIHWNFGGKYDSYKKATCRKYPKLKPFGVIENKQKCKFKEASQK